MKQRKPQVRWPKKWNHLLGVLSDMELSRRAGCDHRTVRRARRKLGIEPAIRCAVLGVVEEVEIEHALVAAERSIRAIATEFGVCSRTIERRAARLREQGKIGWGGIYSRDQYGDVAESFGFGRLA